MKYTSGIGQYCMRIADWLLDNDEALTVMDFYADPTNEPFTYSLSEVLAFDAPEIYNVLSERILSLGLQGRVNSQLAKLYLAKRFEQTDTVQADDITEIRFKFG